MTAAIAAFRVSSESIARRRARAPRPRPRWTGPGRARAESAGSGRGPRAALSKRESPSAREPSMRVRAAVGVGAAAAPLRSCSARVRLGSARGARLRGKGHPGGRRGLVCDVPTARSRGKCTRVFLPGRARTAAVGYQWEPPTTAARRAIDHLEGSGSFSFGWFRTIPWILLSTLDGSWTYWSNASFCLDINMSSKYDIPAKFKHPVAIA